MTITTYLDSTLFNDIIINKTKGYFKEEIKKYKYLTLDNFRCINPNECSEPIYIFTVMEINDKYFFADTLELKQLFSNMLNGKVLKNNITLILNSRYRKFNILTD